MLHTMLHVGGYIFWIMILCVIVLLILGFWEQRKEDR